MAKVKKDRAKRSAFIEQLTLKNTNFIIFGVGILTIIIGYFIMAAGDTYSFQTLTLAPIVLLIGYLVIIPASILYRKKNNKNVESGK